MQPASGEPVPVPPGWPERLALSTGRACAWLFVAAAAITVYEVIARYAFGAPTTWAHVTTTALCAIGFCAGGGYSMARDEHIRVTSLSDRLPASARRFAGGLGLACGAVYLAGLGYAAVLQAREAVWRFEGTRWVPEAVPGPPHWPLPALTRAALAAGVVLFLLIVLRRMALARRKG